MAHLYEEELRHVREVGAEFARDLRDRGDISSGPPRTVQSVYANSAVPAFALPVTVGRAELIRKVQH